MIMNFGEVITILKGKVADPNIGSAKTLKILDAIRRQLDWLNVKHNPNSWYKEFKEIDNELRALAMSDDDE